MKELIGKCPCNSNDKARLLHSSHDSDKRVLNGISTANELYDADNKLTVAREHGERCSDSEKQRLEYDKNCPVQQNVQKDGISFTSTDTAFNRITPSSALDDVDRTFFSRTQPASDDVDGAMFSRTQPALDDVDGAMFSRTQPALDDVDGAMFSRTKQDFDDVDDAMFSRTKADLDDVDGAMFSRTKPDFDDVDGAMFSRTKQDFDDVDGAMFSRTRQITGNERQRRKHKSSPSHLTYSSERPSCISLDYSDGVMFSRSPVTTNRPKPTQITINTFQNDADIPKSPSVDCFKSPTFPVIIGNFPTRQSASAVDLLKHKRNLSDLSGFELGELPSSFDLPDSPLNKAFNDVHSNQTTVNNINIRKDMADGALFNRVNSFKNKDLNQKHNFFDYKNSEVVEALTKLRPWKSLQDVRCNHNENRSKPTDQNVQVIASRESRSVPDKLDSGVRTDLSNQAFSNIEESNIPVVEEPVKREIFQPLGGYRRSVRSYRQDGETEPLQRPQKDNCTRKPLELKHLCTVAFPSVSVILFLSDIGTDINLASRYRQQGDTLFFWVTLMCILIPSVLMSAVDLSWVYRDDVDNAKMTSWNQTKCWKVTRIMLGLLSLGRIVRTVSHIYHSIRSKLYECDRVLHKNRKIEERRDYCMLDVINAFTESCPQLIAQMILIYQFRRPFSADLCVSIVLSWLSIGWAYSCYYRYQKEATRGRNDVKLYVILVFCLAVLSALATRICCIALFLVYYPVWMGILVLLSHFVIMFIWIAFCQKPKLEGLTTSKFGQCLYYLFFSYLSTMYFVNLKEGRSRNRLFTYFAIYYAENCIAAGLLLWKTSFDIRKSVDEFRWSLLIVPLGMVIHISLLTLFYKCCHPPPRDITRDSAVEYVV